MAKPSSSTAITYAREAWKVFRKHAVLKLILAWLFVVPIALVDIIPLLWAPADDRFALAFTILLTILAFFASMWGMCGVYFVGRRLLLVKSGRSRTSLRIVMREASPWVFVLLLTLALRFCFTFYRALLFLIPAGLVIASPLCMNHSVNTLSWTCGFSLLALTPLLIPAAIYQVRTIFTPIALFAEDLRYRAALRRSIALTKGRFWKTVGTLLLLTFFFLAPTFLLSAIVDGMALALPLPARIFAILCSVTASEFGLLLFSLAFFPFYGDLRKHRAMAEARAL